MFCFRHMWSPKCSKVFLSTPAAAVRTRLGFPRDAHVILLRQRATEVQGISRCCSNYAWDTAKQKLGETHEGLTATHPLDLCCCCVGIFMQPAFSRTPATPPPPHLIQRGNAGLELIEARFILRRSDSAPTTTVGGDVRPESSWDGRMPIGYFGCRFH